MTLTLTGYLLDSSGYGLAAFRMAGALAPSSRFQQRDEGANAPAIRNAARPYPLESSKYPVKVKVTMRKSYGFRTFRVTELALYHSLGKLPEPELTHRVF